MTTALAIPDDPILNELLGGWPNWQRWPYRSRWLRDFEDRRRDFYPYASSDELTYTARSVAPFPLAIPNVA